MIPMWPNLKIQSVSGTVKGSQYLINQSKFNLSRNGEVTLNGRISLDQSADYQISSDLRGIDISEIKNIENDEFFRKFLWKWHRKKTDLRLLFK